MAVKKKIQLTDFQKNALTFIALGGIGYAVYSLINKNANKLSEDALNRWLRQNNIPRSTADKVEAFANMICDPNLFVYPTQITALITTMNNQELADFHKVYDQLYKNQLCDDLSPRELLEDEWGNYYANAEMFLLTNGY